MTSEDFDRLYPPLWSWITRTLEAYRGESRSVASVGFQRLPDYFSNKLLAEAKVVARDPLPKPPLEDLGLGKFASLNSIDVIGITYLDTFFVKRDHVQNERLYFHELVHVVQWRRLGPQMFLRVYAEGLEEAGYRESFLEKMAYDMEARFQISAEPFSVEQQVNEQLKGVGLAA
jgi:hypothetical protein